MGMIYVDFAVCSIGVISSVVAAVLWFKASYIKVPDNQDTFIGELQRISRWNARAAQAFGIQPFARRTYFSSFWSSYHFFWGLEAPNWKEQPARPSLTGKQWR